MSRDQPMILIVAGEASGDLYGGLLMDAVSRGASAGAGRPGVPARFIGIGGPSMRSAGLETLGDADTLGVTGLFEVLSKLRALRRAYSAACRVLHDPTQRPDLVVLIDYPDFNLRLAKQARVAGIPVVYFVSPQVWAWRRWRVRQIARSVHRMLVILPFEEEFYRGEGVNAEFVGHPLVDLVRTSRTKDQTLRALGLDPGRMTVGLLPGSRRNEIAAHLPAMLGAARILAREFKDLQFIIMVAPTLRVDEIHALVGRHEGARGGARPTGTGEMQDSGGAPRLVVVGEDRYDAVSASDAVVVASGTATLEAALLGTPMVIVYRMNPLTFVLAKAMSSVPHIGMPNLILGRRIVPELIQDECRPEPIARELRRILTVPAAARSIRQGLAGVRGRLGRPGAIARVAGVILEILSNSQSEASAVQ